MQRLVAKALFDNVAESPDELPFKRGDVITVLEQETGGLEGWWLCSLRGKQGIAPANRLKLMSGMVANHVRSHTADFSSVNQKPDLEWNRRSWDGASQKGMGPVQEGEMYMREHMPGSQPDYDVPRSRYPASGSNHSSREELDASAASLNQSLYDTPPQNRSLRSLDSSLYDTPPSHNHLDPYDIPSGSVRTSLSSKYSDETMSMSSGMSYSKSNPPSMCDSARSSMDISPLDMYDVPPSQKEREARAAMYPVRSSKDSGLDMYDSPPKLKSPPSMIEDYDVPRLAAINCERANMMKGIKIPRSEPSSPGSFLDDYDVPKSQQAGAHSLPPSEEHPNQEDYDVPKQNPIPVRQPSISTIPKRHKSNSLGSLLDEYDTPRRTGNDKVTKDDLFTKARNQLKQQFSDDENNYDEPDAAQTRHVLDIKPPLQKQEHAIDDLYDTPKNNAPVKNMTKEFSELSVRKTPERLGVYDIPPQVTRDSVISSRSDSSDGNDNGSQRLSTCSLDSHGSDIPLYDELPLDLDAANDLVIKLQQDVQKETAKFLSFVNSSWRKKDNLEKKLYDIKQACVNVEQKLGEFVEFGQGTLANSAKQTDRKLISKLSKYLIPLQQALQQIRVCIKHLDDAKWQISKLMVGESPKKDDLGIIASLAKDLTHDVRKLASFIQGNSSLIFKRAKDFNKSSRLSSEHSTPNSAGKPPINRKPALPSKTSNYSSPVQARPLPAPPPTERPLPPTPTEKKTQGFGFSGPDFKKLSGDMANKRNSGDYKHWSGDIHVKRLSADNLSDEKAVFNASDLTQEYDYVELEEEQKRELEKSELLKKEAELQKDKLGEKDEAVLVCDEKDSKESDNYEKELEKTLDDDIEGVNIYSDDSGTLKREKPKSDKVEESETVQDDEAEKTSVNKEQEVPPELPEHDTEPVKLAPLDAEDKQVLSFYSEQLDTHTTLLSNSVEAFFSCIENNQAPKVFISHSKFVVVSAHKLVYIGDSIHKNLKHNEARTNIIQSANHLCDCLKATVTATKAAALQYPSVPAVQEMVDRVVDVSQAAKRLKLLVTRASQL